ncbi:MAG: acyl-coenzyme A synthetase/AMP-(fatty) acid ligase [uncultured archaeon A07HB70]|nr:MAG: acyl-coenzyme A synthetase/AMP-(fatty) acid ligase [uncultured archaeon A07HB70]
MTEHEVAHRPDDAFAEATNVRAFARAHDVGDGDELIARTTDDVEGEPDSGVDWFWDEVVDWLGIEFDEPYDAVRDDTDGPQFTDWYPGSRLNIAHNTVDRHAAGAARNRVATLWEGEDGEVRRVTYHDLARESSRVANALESFGVGVGDRVGIYMPMVPEVVSVLYGCLKAGAVAVPIFSGFGVDATATRLAEPECSVLFTADGFYRRGSTVDLKRPADEAMAEAGCVDRCVVLSRLGADAPTTEGRDVAWSEAVGGASPAYETRSLPSDATSMLLYSSGTTGTPKGIVHTHAGVQVQTAKEIHFGFDQKPGDRFFWVSDIGWMMGPWTLIGNHTFGGTVFLYGGAPDHPGPDRLFEMIDRHGITQFGVSPTAVRSLMRHGTAVVEDHDLSSLRLLGSTGEPWDEESWRWFYDHVGGGQCPIINISGGTEICGCFLMPMPDQPLKPTTLGGPGLGMDIDVVNSRGESVADTGEQGYLVARDSCPSMTKSLWAGDERYLEEYWSTFDGLWNHGDWAQKDEDGFWFLHGRADDALNVAGRKVGPAEVEGALTGHDAANQAAAVGVPDETAGTAIAAFVVLEPDHEPSDAVRGELRDAVGTELGKPFRPRDVRFVPDLPRTQSGKVVRRIIGSVHAGEELGDLSSIENPEAIDAVREAS